MTEPVDLDAAHQALCSYETLPRDLCGDTIIGALAKWALTYGKPLIAELRAARERPTKEEVGDISGNGMRQKRSCTPSMISFFSSIWPHRQRIRTMPLTGNDPRVEAWEKELSGWEFRYEGWSSFTRHGWYGYSDGGAPHKDRSVGPLPRFIDVIDAALEKERGK